MKNYLWRIPYTGVHTGAETTLKKEALRLLTKTESEYYSQAVKKKVLALANADTSHDAAINAALSKKELSPIGISSQSQTDLMMNY